MIRLPHLALGLALLSCNSSQPANPVSTNPTSAPPQPPPGDPTPPKLRLPESTKPLQQSIELTLDPRKESFTGLVEIDVELAAPTTVVWLHGQDLNVSSASITPNGAKPIAAKWTMRDPSGTAELALATMAPAGKAKITIAFEARFSTGQKGLYKTKQGDESYAFTQFEAIAARTAFPCFDEPSFKIPYSMTLVVPKGMVATSNTREVSRKTDGELERISFAKTEKLPSYLLALAVGHLDVVVGPDIPPNAVRTRPVPLRAITAKGRGKEVAYALAKTGEILDKLETYAGVAYPYDKVDIIAIPGKGGAMENPGAVTFGEYFLLFDPKTAPVRQRRAYAMVMAHELAHMWVGDLVTMQWWDDLWLNEAFATWLGNKIADAWDPTVRAELSMLDRIQGAMGTDGLVSARQIRQPIESVDDIENAFDGITYQKGGGVLAMFERWVGPEVFRKGFTAYLEKHRHGNATADDFLSAQDAASGKDVKGAFHTFLDQVGVPFIEAKLTCADKKAGPATIHFTQSRYLPIGSSGDSAKTWKVPICVKYGENPGGESCTLLTEREMDLKLPPAAACPTWIFPNSNAAGYYRFSLAPEDLAALRKSGLPSLSIREKVAYANAVRASFSRAKTPFGDALEALAPLASESDPSLVEEPMGLIAGAREWLYTDPLRAKVEAYGRKLYGPVAKRLGWEAKKGEDDETTILRADILGYLSGGAQDKDVRKEAKKRGLAYIGAGKDNKMHPEAVSPDLAALSLVIVGEEADAATWETMRTLFKSSVEENERSRLLWALSSVRNADLRKKALELAFDDSLRENERLTPLRAQINDDEFNEEAWKWLVAHYDAVLARLPKHHGGVALIGIVNSFCDEAKAAEAEAFFKPKVSTIEGGPRQLALALEGVRLCAAKKKAQEAHVRAFFQKR